MSLLELLKAAVRSLLDPVPSPRYPEDLTDSAFHECRRTVHAESKLCTHGKRMDEVCLACSAIMTGVNRAPSNPRRA